MGLRRRWPLQSEDLGRLRSRVWGDLWSRGHLRERGGGPRWRARWRASSVRAHRLVGCVVVMVWAE
jgi:hypothetical protein